MIDWEPKLPEEVEEVKRIHFFSNGYEILSIKYRFYVIEMKLLQRNDAFIHVTVCYYKPPMSKAVLKRDIYNVKAQLKYTLDIICDMIRNGTED